MFQLVQEEKESSQEKKESTSYQEDTEFANEYPFEEVKTNRSSVNTQANGSPVLETDVVIRRYEMFGESPQIRKAGLVRRAGRIEAESRINRY
ncbi:hypothetical protein EAE99_003315 [Botrytis elliptica]|nr:hypothetical protein EAE99_003315 [Botrytis elliptica]